VLNVPGVEVTISRTNPGAPATSYVRGTGVSDTWFAGIGGEFATGTSFKVKQKLCPDDESDWSPNSLVEHEPDALPAVTFDPPELIVGQPIVHFESIVQGSRVELTETNSSTASSPISPCRTTNISLTSRLRSARHSRRRTT
jgi:hypothetical protein